MELTNPVLVCTTPTNILAHEVAEWLSNTGISAQVIEGSNPLGGQRMPRSWSRPSIIREPCRRCRPCSSLSRNRRPA